MNKRILVGLIAILFVVQAVCAGVSNPSPTELELTRGESGRFKFQIQSIAKPADVLCTASLKGDSPLIVEFDDDEVFVEAGTKKYVYGTVNVPDNISIGVSFDTQGFEVFEENFCVLCRNAEGVGGASVQINTCDLPIKVKVVYVRTRENMYIPPKPMPAPIFPTSLIVLAGITVVLAITYCLYRVYKKKKEVVKPKKKQ